MKLTATWNQNRGEGSFSPADRKRLLDQADDIAALDFAQDVMREAQALYSEMLKAHRTLTTGGKEKKGA